MRTALVLAVTCAIAVPTADGQGILNRMKKKAAEAVEKKAEDKMNAKLDELSSKLVDNSFNAIFGEATPGAGGGSGSAGGAGGGAGSGGASRLPFSIGTNAKTEAVYTFNVVVATELDATDRSGKGGKAAITMHFNTNEAYTGTKIESADGKQPEGAPFIVLDAKNQAMVMMMSGDKKFSIAYDWKDAARYAQSAPAEQVNWDTVTTWRNYRKIGTKTIAGFTADGYRTESPDGNAEVWVSRDRRLGDGRLFSANSGLKQMKGSMPAEFPHGMVLEMSSERANGDKVTMRVTRVDTNARVSYSMTDYPKMELGKK